MHNNMVMYFKPLKSWTNVLMQNLVIGLWGLEWSHLQYFDADWLLMPITFSNGGSDGICKFCALVLVKITRSNNWQQTPKGKGLLLFICPDYTLKNGGEKTNKMTSRLVWLYYTHTYILYSKQRSRKKGNKRLKLIQYILYFLPGDIFS